MNGHGSLRKVVEEPLLRILVLLSLIFILTSMVVKQMAYAQPGTGILAGASRVAITPTMPVFLAGLDNNRVSSRAHDDIWARGLAVTVGGDTVIFVALDLIGFFYNHIEQVRDMVSAQIPVPRENILIGSTHLHSGPDTIGFWGETEFSPGVNPEYMEQLKKLAAQSAVEAYNNREQASLCFGTAKAPGVSVNIRDAGVLDDTAYVLGAVDAHGKTIAVMINFAMHPEILWSDNLFVTSDFAFYLREKVEKELGGTAIFFNRDLGGMVTADVKDRTFDEAKRIGETLAMAVVSAIKNAKPLNPDKLRLVYKKLSLPIDNPLLSDPSVLQALDIDRPMDGINLSTEITALRLDKLIIATLPGEVQPKLGARIRDSIPTPDTMLLGLTNDELGYILPPEDFMRDVYTYERTRSLGPNTGAVVEETIKELVSKLQ